VKTDFNKKSVVISVDSQASAPVLAKGNTLDVENKLYLGGLPHTYTAKKIGNVCHTTPHSLFLRLHYCLSKHLTVFGACDKYHLIFYSCRNCFFDYCFGLESRWYISCRVNVYP
jgi:hypothetical protein